MNNNTFEVLADGAEEGELVSVESFKFTGLVPDGKVSIQEENFSKTDYPSTVSLLACSGKYGYFVAGHVQGFVFGQTKALRDAFYSSDKGVISTLNDKTIIPLAKPVYQLRLSCNEQTILAALSDGTILSFSVTDIMEQKQNAQAKHTINLGTPIIDLRPNTEFLPDSACVLLAGNQCRIINWKTGETVANIPGSDFSAICWSPKGKQVVCGRLEGTLEHYDLTGVKKDTLPSPESMQAGYDDENVNRAVQDVLWIENHQFLVLYSRPPEPESDEFINTGYIVDRKPKVGTGPKYTHLSEVTPIFSPEGRSNHFYMETIYGFGDRFPHIIILANGATNEISVVGEDDQGNWATWDLPENGMASLPLSEETNFDTFPLGLALDFSASEKLPPYDPSESDVGVEPVPVLFHLNDEGQLGSFHCYNEDFAIAGTKYQGMKTATLPTADTESTTTESTPAQSTTPAFGAASSTTPSAFGTASSTTPSAFGTASPSPFSASSFSSGPFGAALNSGSSGSSFASLTKVQGATTPSFHGMGSSSGFGSLAKNTVPNAVTPTFGSTTSFGASSSPSAPAFGSTTSFGSSPAPAFGSTTSFGSLQKKDTAPAFGSTTSFGSLQKKDTAPAFGSTTSFGSQQKDSAPTTTAFGSVEKKQDTPAFAATTGGFASFGKKEAPTNTSLPFGSTGFGAAPSTAPEEEKKDSPESISSFENVTKEDTADEPQETTTDKKTADVPLFDSLAIDDKAGKEPVTSGNEDDAKAEKEPATSGNEDDNKDKEIPTGEDDTNHADKVDDDDKKATPEEESLLTTGCLATAKPVPAAPLTSTATQAEKTPTSGFSFGSLAKDKSTPSFGSTTGFGAPAKDKPAPSFGSTTGFGAPAQDKTTPSFGSTTGFGALAKNTVPGASNFGGLGGTPPSSTPATSFGGGGFGALSKNTVPGATAPTFGSTSSLGSGFGALAKNKVPGATNPTSSPAFGSTSSFGSLEKNSGATTFGSSTKLGSDFGKAAVPSSTTTSAPTKPLSAAVSADSNPPHHVSFKEPEQAEAKTKEQDKAAAVPSGPKPEAKEGMAKEFEALYFMITDKLEKLSTLQADFGQQLQDQGKQLHAVTKSVQNLTDSMDSWRLDESAVIGTIADNIGEMLNKTPVKDQQTKMEQLDAKMLELESKRVQIKQCLETDQDPDLINRLAERDLDETTREECEALETKSQRSGELLGELEYRFVNKTQQQRKPIQTDTSHFSFYDFHCAIRDVERDLKRKDAEVKDLERKLSLLRFREHQRKAEFSPSTITFEDVSDDDEEEGALDGHYSQEHIDYTVKYIQEEQTLDKLCALTCQRPPFTAKEGH